MKSNQSSVSRDTRVLLTIVAISIATLWALARLRFPDRPPTPNLVPPVLAQLTPPSAFDDIVSVVAQLETRLRLSILGMDVERRGSANAPAMRTTVSALRFRDDLAVALLGGTSSADRSDAKVVGATEVARDRASTLAVVRLPAGIAPELSTWTARRPSYPRFLVAGDVSPAGVSLRPVFVGSFHAVLTPIWSDPLWALPDRIGLAPGTFVFTLDGELAGLVVEHEGRPALVPANAVVSTANRMMREDQKRPARVGVEVQALDGGLAAATGGKSGVVVSWVDPEGAAARELRATDVVESIDGRPTPTVDHWLARMARLTDGESLVLSVRRASVARDVRLVARAVTEPGNRPLGLTLRTIPRIGAEIVHVDANSSASSADLRAGDVLTVVGDTDMPNAAQAARAFAGASRERPVIVAFTRAGTHYVLALEKTW
jgi:hypothetical protein